MSFKDFVTKRLVRLLSIDELVAKTFGPLLSSSGEYVTEESVKRLFAVSASTFTHA